ncbi:hypothetical protein F2S70_23035 [Pseudomonas syringae pv. actinidiae]|nr:hypothetical protein [Pseudomonas syringae pv. actinidiae]
MARSEYLGRLDQQVKLRGFRVEPQEIEARLLAQTGVGHAAVLVRETAAGPQLIGYYTAEAGQDVQAERIKSALALELPDYMVPAQLVRLDSMPLSPSGKLDRRALPEPQWQTREHVEPHTDLQSRSPLSGVRCWACRVSACAMTFSSWAGTRCWPRRSFPVCARPATSTCRCARCLRPASWAHSSNRFKPFSSQAHATACNRLPVLTAVSRCRCPIRNSACGSSGRWSRTARRTTSAAWHV